MNARNDNSTTRCGMSLLTVLGVLFIALKLTGHISWSWWWVLAPFYPGIILAILAIIYVIASVALVIVRHVAKRRARQQAGQK